MFLGPFYKIEIQSFHKKKLIIVTWLYKLGKLKSYKQICAWVYVSESV